MSNMTYCMFRNTLTDLEQCRDSMDSDLSAEEGKARARMLVVCAEILEQARFMGIWDDDEAKQ